MQLKSVKPQTPALFSDAYFIIAPLSPFLPGVETLLCMRLIFILLITLLHAYLGVAPNGFFFTFSISIGQSLSLLAAKCDLTDNLGAWIYFH